MKQIYLFIIFCSQSSSVPQYCMGYRFTLNSFIVYTIKTLSTYGQLGFLILLPTEFFSSWHHCLLICLDCTPVPLYHYPHLPFPQITLRSSYPPSALPFSLSPLPLTMSISIFFSYPLHLSSLSLSLVISLPKENNL